ncbi:MAG: TauD/TfdA family dioxygenase [Gammaproteobacteria bacterium]|nr:TauD/TfdA family dioxygenase [Gammaproteobacteria bacterium]
MLEVRKAAGALGAFVSGASLADVARDSALFERLHALALEHHVLFFRGQHIEPLDFQAFARRFGPVLGHPAYPLVPGTEDVQVLESTPEAPSKIEEWHSDMTFSATPPTYTLLHGQIIPEFGGDTLWASAVAAYDALSKPMQGLLDGLQAVHDFRHGFRESLAEPGGEERLAGAVAANPPVSHPLIRTHPESGARAIYVNPLFTTHIEGLTASESRDILSFLYRHTVTPEFTVRLSWEPHTAVIWDNRSVQHKPVNDFFPQHRKLHRVTITGDRPR